MASVTKNNTTIVSVSTSGSVNVVVVSFAMPNPDPPPPTVQEELTLECSDKWADRFMHGVGHPEVKFDVTFDDANSTVTSAKAHG